MDDDSDLDDIKSLNFSSNNVSCSLIINEELQSIINMCNDNFSQNDSDENDSDENDSSAYTIWIIDSGTGINIVSDANKLENLKTVGNRKITYANGISEQIRYI